MGEVVLAQEAPPEDGLMKDLPYLHLNEKAHHGTLVCAVKYGFHILRAVNPLSALYRLLVALQD